MNHSLRFSLAIVLATILAVCLTCSWSLHTVQASHQTIPYESIQELFEPTSDSWSNEAFMLEMASHPSFDEHLDSVLSDLQDFEFDIESDDALLQYMSTLSDSEAKAQFRRFRRAFRRIGRAVRRAGRAFRKVGKGLKKVARGVVKVVKKYGAVIAPIALTIATGGIGGVSLAGSLGSIGSTVAKGAAIIAKASSIASKAQAVMGGLNMVTGGKSKFLNKAMKFTNKVTGVLGKGSMILNAGGSLVNGLSNMKGLASQLKPSNLFKGSNLFEKGSNFLNKASGLIKKGQEFTSNLNNLTGGKIKALNKISKGLDKAQSIAGIGTDALKGLNGGFNSLKNLKNLKNIDMKKLLTSENIKKGLGKLDSTIGKTQDILSRVNDVSGGKSKKLNKIIGALDKGKLIVNAGSTAVDRVKGIKNSIKDLKNLKNADIKKLFTNEGIQKAFGKLDSSLSKGKDFLQQVNAINGGKSKTLNKLIQKIEKGQQAVSIGSTATEQFKGIKSSIEQLSKMKSSDLKKLLTFDNVQTGLGKAQNAMAGAQDLVQKLNEFTNGRSKTLVSLVEKLQKGQKLTAVSSSILDGAKGVKGSIEQLKNLKKEDFKKILDAEHLQGVLNNAASAFSKGENIVSQLNELTNGKNKNLVKLLDSLRKGQMITNTASSGVETYKSAKNSVEELKKLRGKNLKEILKSDELHQVVDSWKGTISQGKDFVSQVKDLKNELKKKKEEEAPVAIDEVPINNAEEPVDGVQQEPDQSSVNQQEPIIMNNEEPNDSEIDPATAMG